MDRSVLRDASAPLWIVVEIDVGPEDELATAVLPPLEE